MKNISTKALMVITLMLASFIAAPVMISANGDDGELDFSQIGGDGFIAGFESLLGGIFGGMGQAGNLLDAVFSMLLMQTLENFSGAEILDNVYALSATTIETYNDTRMIQLIFTPYHMNITNHTLKLTILAMVIASLIHLVILIMKLNTGLQ